MKTLDKTQLLLPKVFISYSWEDDNHKSWVKSLADSLLRDGIDVMLDQYDIIPGDRITTFMEHSITVADYVLIICTPHYKQIADSRDGQGVVYETNIISTELYEQHNERKFIPILRRGTFSSAWPIYLRGKLGVDLSNTGDYLQQYQLLLRTLRRESQKPPLGIIPC